MVKNLPAMQETRVQSLGWEDPLEREWQLTPVFLPGEFHRQRSLVAYSPGGRKESDTTGQLTQTSLSSFLFLVFGIWSKCLVTGELGVSHFANWTYPLTMYIVTVSFHEPRLCICYSMDKPRQCIKKQRHYFANKGPYSQGDGFSRSHIWMWELDNKEGWESKNWCFWIVVLKKTLESSLDCKEFKPVTPKGNQSWIFIGRTDTELKLQYFGPLMHRANSLEQTLLLGKIEGRGRTGWQRMRWLGAITDNFEQPPGDGEGQGCLVCCGPWGCKELDTTEWLNNSDNAMDS